MNQLGEFILTIGLLLFAFRRSLRYLMYFQQEGYESERFFHWFRSRRAFDTRGSIAAVTALAAARIFGHHQIWFALLGLALFVIAWIVEADPRESGKVRLKMTQRAMKIMQLAILLYAVLLGFYFYHLNYTADFYNILIRTFFVIQTVPFFILLSNLLLAPLEKVVQEKFKNEALAKLAQIQPFVIGITGSYGKTSTKAILGDLLNQCVGSTHWPRGSINTVMGITRDIRENLRPSHQFSIIEMGAYGVGSIRRLCEFTPPKAAIVTAVGVMHLERFESVDAIYKAKSELAQALRKDDILVCNGDNPGARRMAKEYETSRTFLYGIESPEGVDCYAKDIQLSTSGTSFTIVWEGKEYPVKTPLLGRPAISNALGAFTLVCALGGEPTYVAASLSTTQPVTNRLSLEKGKGVRYLQDAFNSNPIGFTAALEVLKESGAKRRILITPGMIELGKRQYEDNKSVAEYAGQFLELAVIVGTTNRAALIDGLTKAGMASEKIITVESRNKGFETLKTLQQDGDVVLIENDLPDLYEGNARF